MSRCRGNEIRLFQGSVQTEFKPGQGLTVSSVTFQDTCKNVRDIAYIIRQLVRSKSFTIHRSWIFLDSRHCEVTIHCYWKIFEKNFMKTSGILPTLYVNWSFPNPLQFIANEYFLTVGTVKSHNTFSHWQIFEKNFMKTSGILPTLYVNWSLPNPLQFIAHEYFLTVGTVKSHNTLSLKDFRKKFHENPSIGSRVLPCELADMAKLRWFFATLPTRLQTDRHGHRHYVPSNITSTCKTWPSCLNTPAWYYTWPNI